MHITHAVICWNCGCVNAVTDARGETCPTCAGAGGLQNLAQALYYEDLPSAVVIEQRYLSDPQWSPADVERIREMLGYGRLFLVGKYLEEGR